MIGIVIIYSYFLVEFGKPAFLSNLYPGIVIQSVALLYLFHNRKRSIIILKDKLIILYMLLLLEMVYHGPTASNNFWALKKFESMLGNLIFMLLFCVVIDSESRLMQVLAGYVVCMLIISISQITLGYRGYFGTTGSLGDTNDLAAAMNVVIPICYYVGNCFKSYKKIFYWVAGLLFVMCNISCVSRSGFIGMCVIALLIIYGSKNKYKTIAIATVIGVMLAYTYIPTGYSDEIYSISDGADTGTGKQRIELWKIALATFYHNPILGVGQGNVEWVYERYQDPNNKYWGRGVGGKAVHSIYVTLLAELGIIGAAIFLMMLVNVRKKFINIDRKYKRKNPEGNGNTLFCANRGVTYGLVGFLVSGIFLSSFYYPQIWNMFGFIISIGNLSGEGNEI